MPATAPAYKEKRKTGYEKQDNDLFQSDEKFYIL